MSTSALKADRRDVSAVQIEKFTYQWSIKGFRHLRMQPGEKLESPIFSFGSKSDVNWYLRLHPNGDSKDCENYLSLYLCWESSDIINGEFSLSLIDENQEKQEEEKIELSSKTIDSDGRGWASYINRDELLDEANGLLPDDCLTINCDIMVVGEVAVISENNKKLELSYPGSSWLGKLFLEESFSDVKLIVTSFENKSLPAHRAVLAARSPVFEAMFSHEMQEQKLGEVKIEDADYEIIKEMLRFIYLGEVENIESSAIQLLELAHKYQIQELIEFCANALVDQLMPDNVLKCIQIADNYNIENLKSRAIDFAKANIKDVVKTDDFKSSNYLQAQKSVLEAFANNS